MDAETRSAVGRYQALILSFLALPCVIDFDVVAVVAAAAAAAVLVDDLCG